MADVVVDAKPMAQLPYDPNDIPDAVKKRVAAVEALYQPSGSGEGPSPETPEPQPPETPAAQVSAPDASSQPIPVVPPAPAPPPPPEDENAKTWKDRFLTMQGRYNASQRTLAEMQEQMTQLGNELLNTQQQPVRPQSPSPPPPQAYITDQDVQNYGPELLDFTQRAATQALTPHLQALTQQNAELQKRLAQEARYRLDQAVEMAIPNYLEIDRDPRWHNWLLGIDVYAKRVRQQLLNEAIATADAPRVIQFFKGFLNEEAATGHREPAPQSQQAVTPPPRTPPAYDLATLAAPGRTRPATGGESSMPPEKPLYTRAQLRELYSQHRRGAFNGREAEWARIDADIIAAGREGRVRD